MADSLTELVREGIPLSRRVPSREQLGMTGGQDGMKKQRLW